MPDLNFDIYAASGLLGIGVALAYAIVALLVLPRVPPRFLHPELKRWGQVALLWAAVRFVLTSIVSAAAFVTLNEAADAAGTVALVILCGQFVQGAILWAAIFRAVYLERRAGGKPAG